MRVLVLRRHLCRLCPCSSGPPTKVLSNGRVTDSLRNVRFPSSRHPQPLIGVLVLPWSIDALAAAAVWKGDKPTFPPTCLAAPARRCPGPRTSSFPAVGRGTMGPVTTSCCSSQWQMKSRSAMACAASETTPSPSTSGKELQELPRGAQSPAAPFLWPGVPIRSRLDCSVLRLGGPPLRPMCLMAAEVHCYSLSTLLVATTQ